MEETGLFGIVDTITGLYYHGKGKWGEKEKAMKKPKSKIRAMIGGLRNGTKNPLTRVSMGGE